MDEDDYSAFVPGNYSADHARRENTRLFAEIKTLLIDMQRRLALTPEFDGRIKSLMDKLKNR